MKINSLTGLVAGLSMLVGVSTHAQSAVSVTQNTRTALTHALSDKLVSQLSLNQLQSALVEQINRVRIKHGLQPLKLYDHPIAQQHSTYLFTSKNDTSIGFDDHFAQGQDIYTRIEQQKTIPLDTECRGDCKRVGENLASSDMTIQDTIDARLQSPAHADNLLSPSFDHIVVGCAPGGNNLVVDFLNLK